MTFNNSELFLLAVWMYMVKYVLDYIIDKLTAEF